MSLSVIQADYHRSILRHWLLSSPALLIVLLAATGPLLVVLLYSFLAAGPYGGVLPGFRRKAGSASS